MNNFIKKNLNILMFISLLIIFAVIQYFVPIISLDEIWKYQHSKALNMGFLLYKDINVLTTPFYFFITSLFLKMNETLIMFRVFCILMWSCFYFVIYKIFKLYFKNNLSFLFTYFLIFIHLFKCNGYYMFDYNSCFILVLLLVNYFLISFDKDKTSISYFFIGLLLAIGDLSKHTVGLIFLILIFVLIIFKYIKNKKDILFLSLGIFIPNFIFLIYLLVNNIFFDFLDICFFGLFSFGKENNFPLINYLFQNPLNLIFFCVSIYCLLLIIFKYIKNKQNTYILFILSLISLFLLGFPIFDDSHTLFFFIYSVLVYFILSKEDFFEKLNNKNIFFIPFLVFIIIVYLCYSIYYNPLYVKSNINNMKGLNTFKEKEYIINVLDNFIEENYGRENTIILCIDSCIFSVKNNSFNGVFDCFFKGNFGSKTALDYLKAEIDKGKIICICNHYKDENSKNPGEVYDYLKNNLSLIDEFEYFEFYKNIQ